MDTRISCSVWTPTSPTSPASHSSSRWRWSDGDPLDQEGSHPGKYRFKTRSLTLHLSLRALVHKLESTKPNSKNDRNAWFALASALNSAHVRRRSTLSRIVECCNRATKRDDVNDDSSAPVPVSSVVLCALEAKVVEDKPPACVHWNQYCFPASERATD